MLHKSYGSYVKTAGGYLDLTLKFDRQEVVELLGEVDDGDVIVLVITGQLRDGTPIKGEDVVWIIKKGKEANSATSSNGGNGKGKGK